MSLRSPPRADATERESNRGHADGEQLLALLDAEYTREILAAVRGEARSARAVARESGASRPTVYRRLNSLAAAGLVSAETEYDPDGHHRTVFEATLDAISVEVGADGVELTVSRDRPVSGDRPARRSA